MVDSAPQFEVKDTEGDTLHYSVTSAGTSPVSYPAVAGGIISQVMIQVDPDNNPNSYIEVSFDGGTGWFPLFEGAALGWVPKGNLTQIQLKASAAGLDYYLLINREPS